jgi:hypothetical protein
VAKSEVGLAQRGHGTRRHLQDFQGRFSRRTEKRSAPQEHDSVETASTDPRDGAKVTSQHAGASLAEPLAEHPVAVGGIDQTQESSRHAQVCKTAGHHQTAIIGCVVQNNNPDVVTMRKSGGQLAFPITGKDEVPKLGICVE